MRLVFKMVDVLFWVFLALLLLGGLVIVGGQTVGVFGLSESLVVGISDNAGPWVYSCATLCGVFAFLTRYRPKEPHERRVDED